MNGISFHTARGQRIVNVEFSLGTTQDEIDKLNQESEPTKVASMVKALRFTLFGGETVTINADALVFKGAAKGRAVDDKSGLPTIQVGNDGTLNNPGSHRVDQGASLSDWLVQWYDWKEDKINYAVIDSSTLHSVTRRGAN